MPATVIDSSSRVTLNFSLALADGSMIDSNFDSPPVSFVMGDGNLLPGFEKQLLGLGEGQAGEFHVTALDAFGLHNENNVQRIGRDKFSQQELEPGLVISFADAAGAELPGVITELDQDYATIDFNHPLASRDIVFKVQIVAVEQRAGD